MKKPKLSNKFFALLDISFNLCIQVFASMNLPDGITNKDIIKIHLTIIIGCSIFAFVIAYIIYAIKMHKYVINIEEKYRKEKGAYKGLYKKYEKLSAENNILKTLINIFYSKNIEENSINITELQNLLKEKKDEKKL